MLSYAELAPHLATRVQALQSAIAAGEYDRRTLDENLLLELYRRICADLIPDIAGRWRTSDVVVGDHERLAYLEALLRAADGRASKVVAQ